MIFHITLWKREENEKSIRIVGSIDNNISVYIKCIVIIMVSAKAYAERKVTTNQGKKTPGVNKKIWSTSASKMKAVLQLTDKQYRTKPL